MAFELEFNGKDVYEDIVDIFGGPPCSACLVQAMCKREQESAGKTYSLILEEVCTPMEKWIDVVKHGNLLRKQIEKMREDEAYREKITGRLLEIAKKHFNER
jgi:hypothetical protein